MHSILAFLYEQFTLTCYRPKPRGVLANLKRLVEQRWNKEYHKALRERHNLKHKTKQMVAKIGMWSPSKGMSETEGSGRLESSEICSNVETEWCALFDYELGSSILKCPYNSSIHLSYRVIKPHNRDTKLQWTKTRPIRRRAEQLNRKDAKQKSLEAKRRTVKKWILNVNLKYTIENYV